MMMGRRILITCAAGVVSLAGCLQTDESGRSSDNDEDDSELNTGDSDVPFANLDIEIEMYGTVVEKQPEGFTPLEPDHELIEGFEYYEMFLKNGRAVIDEYPEPSTSWLVHPVERDSTTGIELRERVYELMGESAEDESFHVDSELRAGTHYLELEGVPVRVELQNAPIDEE